jgi:hypothetical protein
MRLPTQDKHILVHDINDACGTAGNNGMPPEDDALSAMQCPIKQHHQHVYSNGSPNRCCAIFPRTEPLTESWFRELRHVNSEI